jgi:hypothetical protein
MSGFLLEDVLLLLATLNRHKIYRVKYYHVVWIAAEVYNVARKRHGVVIRALPILLIYKDNLIFFRSSCTLSDSTVFYLFLQPFRNSEDGDSKLYLISVTL